MFFVLIYYSRITMLYQADVRDITVLIMFKV